MQTVCIVKYVAGATIPKQEICIAPNVEQDIHREKAVHRVQYAQQDIILTKARLFVWNVGMERSLQLQAKQLAQNVNWDHSQILQQESDVHCVPWECMQMLREWIIVKHAKQERSHRHWVQSVI